MAKRMEKVKAVAYLRTSSAANTGADKDSDKRQRLAIQRYAKSSGHVIADDDWYYDEAISGADLLETRPGWQALMARILSNGVRTVIVEGADRFARDLLVQEHGVRALSAEGVKLLTSSGDNLTDSNDPSRVMVRQLLGSFSEYEKARLVAKLKGARDRRSEAAGGRIEGRKPHYTAEAVREAKRLRRASPLQARRSGEAQADPHRMSYRDIATKLAELGYVTKAGKPFNPNTVARMLAEG